MRSFLPVLIGAAVVAAGLGLLLLWQPEPPLEQILAPSLERVRADLNARALVEGRDYRLDPPIVLSRTDAEIIVRHDVKAPAGELGREYHRLVKDDTGWKLDRDLRRSFSEFVEKESRAACDRLGKRLAERYQDKVDIPGERVKIGHRLRESEPAASKEVRVIGSLDIRYLDAGGEGRYVEDFTFSNGTWTMDGTAGQLFDRGPRVK